MGQTGITPEKKGNPVRGPEPPSILRKEGKHISGRMTDNPPDGEMADATEKFSSSFLLSFLRNKCHETPLDHYYQCSLGASPQDIAELTLREQATRLPLLRKNSFRFRFLFFVEL